MGVTGNYCGDLEIQCLIDIHIYYVLITKVLWKLWAKHVESETTNTVQCFYLKESKKSKFIARESTNWIIVCQ